MSWTSRVASAPSSAAASAGVTSSSGLGSEVAALGEAPAGAGPGVAAAAFAGVAAGADAVVSPGAFCPQPASVHTTARARNNVVVRCMANRSSAIAWCRDRGQVFVGRPGRLARWAAKGRLGIQDEVCWEPKQLLRHLTKRSHGCQRVHIVPPSHDLSALDGHDRDEPVVV